MGIDIARLIPDEAVEQARQQRDEEFELWPEHEDVAKLFMACGDQWITQWVVAGTVVRQVFQGLDFTRAGEIASWLGLKKTPELFWQLKVLVDEAKPLRNA